MLYVGIFVGLYISKHHINLKDPNIISRYGSYFDEYVEKAYFYFAVDSTITILLAIATGSASEISEVQAALMASLKSLGFVLLVVLAPCDDKVIQTDSFFSHGALQAWIGLCFALGVGSEWMNSAIITLTITTIFASFLLMIKDPAISFI